MSCKAGSEFQIQQGALVYCLGATNEIQTGGANGGSLTVGFGQVALFTV